jgi:hypothetical protein
VADDAVAVTLIGTENDRLIVFSAFTPLLPPLEVEIHRYITGTAGVLVSAFAVIIDSTSASPSPSASGLRVASRRRV